MVNLNLEVHIIPVHDADRAKEFYQRLGWRLDADDALPGGVRIVQFTPPGSGCSVSFGSGITTAAPGTFQGALVVGDIELAHKDLAGHGIEVGDIFHGPAYPRNGRQPGRHPERASYASFFPFQDTEGNEWLVQEVTTRLPGRD